MVEKSFYGNTILVKKEWVEELNLEYIELKEKTLGSTIIHLKTDDPENLFCIALKTYPHSSNGVAHILEHTVLCGSQKYPIADPFFSMIRRSLATFMNAFTGQDFTCYPAASLVKKDFYNLLDVYLDAVFYPDLDRLSFLQEGFRLSAENIEDPQSTLRMDGVVFNEMKGSFASAKTRLSKYIHQHLYKDSTYHYVSGGDPEIIPSITYQDLLDFHQKYYHPSHAIFFFYGNSETEEHLEYLDKRIFSKATPAPPLPSLKKEPKKSKPDQAHYHYPSNEEHLEDKHYLSFGYLTCDLEMTTEVIALQLIDALLMEHDGSLLRSKILESGLCSHCYSLIDTEMKQIPWVFVAEGCRKENIPLLKEKIQSELSYWSKNSFPKEKIETQLHQIMLENLEISDHGLTYGLSLFFRSMLLKMHDQDPLKGLQMRKTLDALKTKIEKDPFYLSNVLNRWTIQNPHQSTIILEPSIELETQENEKEKKLLKSMVDKLTERDRLSIINTQKQLLKKQQTPQNVSILPKLHVEDIQKEPTFYHLENNENFYWHDCFTNGFGYITYSFDLPEIALDDLPYFYLYTHFLFELGTHSKNWKERLEQWQRYTGGVSCYWTSNLSVDEKSTFSPLFCVEGRALDENLPSLFNLMTESINETNFNDLQRIEILFDQYYLSLINSVNNSALSYIVSLCKSAFSPAQTLNDHYKGSIMLNALRKLKVRSDKAQFLSEKFKFFHEKIFSSTPEVCFTGNKTSAQFFKDHDLCSGPKKAKMVLPIITPLSSQIKEIVSHVVSNVTSFPSCGYTSVHAPAMSLLSFLLENTFLHTQIREQGGAYHVRAEYDHLQHLFTIYSTQDPHLTRTQEKMDETPLFLQQYQFSDQEIEEAKLRFFQAVDSPLSPGQRGDSTFFQLKRGLTKDRRRAFRKKILNISQKEITKAIEEVYLPNYEKKIYIGACSMEKYKSSSCKLPISRF